MNANSSDIEAVAHDWYFFMDFNYVCGDAGEYKEYMYTVTYPAIHSLVHGKHDGANFEPLYHSIRKLRLF